MRHDGVPGPGPGYLPVPRRDSPQLQFGPAWQDSAGGWHAQVARWLHVCWSRQRLALLPAPDRACCELTCLFSSFLPVAPCGALSKTRHSHVIQVKKYCQAKRQPDEHPDANGNVRRPCHSSTLWAQAIGGENLLSYLALQI